MSALQVIVRQFNGAECELLQKEDGSVWMTSEQIGLALGYSGDPGKKIRKVYERHIDELRSFKGELKLTRPGVAAQLTTIWQKEALYLFAMFARTETAKSFRMWVTRTCRELEAGDKVLVDRSVIEGYEQRIASLLGSTGALMTSMASLFGSGLASFGAAKRHHPELFGIPTRQRFFAFYEEVLESDPEGVSLENVPQGGAS